ncbi:MAG: glutamate synthase subunit beta, partial [Lachnoclostridium sp.]|nr:glutamate synthase subunit beta [Lachnoclostridium sp.]
FCQSGMMIGGMASGCPLNNLIPEWNDLIYNNNLEEALSRLTKTNSFPEFTSRVCPAPCEAACTCGLNDKPVTIKENENAIIEYGFEKGLIKACPPKVRTDKKIAIIGSGASGLACAASLNKRGHHVTVFERSDRPGGLLMYGIPNMKLEKSVIERRINLMKEEGIVFKTGVNVGVDIKAEDLKKEFDAVVLCCGASHPRNINAPGREAKGIYFAVDFLTRATKHVLNKSFKDFYDAKDKNVIVIGGGDTGNDCVGTSIRMGCKSIMQLEMMPKAPECRRENNPWPEWPKILKTDYGQEEAIAVFGHDPRLYQTTVKEFIADKTGKLIKVKTVGLDSSFKEIPDSEKEYPADIVLIAAGFLGSEEYVYNDFKVKVTQRTNVLTEAGSYKTSEDKVFTAGDMHRGQSLIVWAIREGREAAKEVDKYLLGYTNL